MRESKKHLPFFRYLSVKNFKLQLEYFEKEFGIVTYDEFVCCLNGSIDYATLHGKVVLTFDDGFSDHYESVFPVLKKRGLLGIFYIPTGVYKNKKALDVHRIHYLLGKVGGRILVDTLKEQISEKMIDRTHYNEFNNKTYHDQINDDATDEFKKLLNYYIAYEYREIVLDALVEKFASDEEIYDGLYLGLVQIREMKEANMIIGSHSVNHYVMSKLSIDEQRYEIETSFEFMEQNIGEQSIKTFCYPYGGFHSFTQDTEEILQGLKCNFSFNVESRDIEELDFIKRPQALPRYDCNFFPYGKASMGVCDVL